MIPLRDDIPSRTFPIVNVAFIAVNVMVFIYQMSLGAQGVESFIYRTAAIPAEITSFDDIAPAAMVPVPWTLVTAMFVHGGLLHAAGNMLFLWIFGDNVEDAFGHLLFFVFYMLSGVAASLVHVAVEPASTIPMVGASGAIAGVLGAYFMLFPRAQILTLVILPLYITTTRLPAIFFLGFWFLLQVLNSGAAAGAGVAWYAHIGGFVAGVAAALLYKGVMAAFGRR